LRKLTKVEERELRAKDRQENMPRGKAGRGGMGKRTRKGNNTTKRELWYKEEGQEYAQVLAMLGNGKLKAMCFDGKTRLATIRGKMRRRVYIFVSNTFRL